MNYKKIKPCQRLAPFIHFYWELKGNDLECQWERVFPDGCAGILINLGDRCLTDNGAVSMEFGKTYIVGAMNSFKETLIDVDTHLLGVCLKPAAFANFYSYAPQDELTNDTIELEKSNSYAIDKLIDDPYNYLNLYYINRLKTGYNPLTKVIDDIHYTKGKIGIDELSKRNFTTSRQLERNFKKLIGLSPKAYSSIIQFQQALKLIKSAGTRPTLSEIAYDCGYYDQAHLTHAFKRNTGHPPSEI